MINTKKLSQALKEHTKKEIISRGPDEILINGMLIKFRGNLLLCDKASFRFEHIKELLLQLRIENFLDLDDKSISHVANRYRHLMNNKQ